MSRKPNRDMRQVATSIPAETLTRLLARHPGEPIFRVVRLALEAYAGAGEAPPYIVEIDGALIRCASAEAAITLIGAHHGEVTKCTSR